MLFDQPYLVNWIAEYLRDSLHRPRKQDKFRTERKKRKEKKTRPSEERNKKRNHEAWDFTEKKAFRITHQRKSLGARESAGAELTPEKASSLQLRTRESVITLVGREIRMCDSIFYLAASPTVTDSLLDRRYYGRRMYQDVVKGHRDAGCSVLTAALIINDR